MKEVVKKIILARMPPKNLIMSLANIAKYKVRNYYTKIFPVTLSDKGFFKATEHQNINQLPPFFFNPNNREENIDAIKKEYPSSIIKTLNDADEVCDHIFDLLGSGKTKMIGEIDFHLDFKSGFRWNPKGYYLGTGKHVSLDDDSDVKVPWELSRCQHFVILGKAYWYSKENKVHNAECKIDAEKYAREFVSQIEGWISQNPVELGVNWACTMDVAIRAINWIWGYYFFYDSPALTKEFKTKLFKWLFLHGRHIINNLEYGLLRSNHYLSDIAGLIYLGILFRETKEGKKWLEKGLKALKKEMQVQIYPDGVDSEGSISYHRLVTELFLSTTLLCLKNGIIFPGWYMSRLEKMIVFVMYYTKPDGTAPQIGDNDDGRLHILGNYGSWDRLDHRYLLSVGAALFKRQDFKVAAGEFHEEAFWLLGEDGLNSFAML